MSNNGNDKRLIEDFLPIQAISAEASREKSVRKGHISTLHLWWARRPLVACRAAVYGALVPASRFIPENGPDNKKQSLGRANAAKFMKRLCRYPSDSKSVQKADIELAVKEAQRHILEAHAERLTEETGKKVTAEDIEEGRAPRPKVLDMFAGGGAIPLEALRLGCEAYAIDLNPVAHIIELCTLVYPQKYGKPDLNVRGMAGPKNAKGETTWGGLGNEVRCWGEWVLKKVKDEIGDLYPSVPDPKAPSQELAPGKQGTLFKNPTGQQKLTIPGGYLTPVAYLWTRTVQCKNPSCGATVPLVRQTWLCKKKGRYIALKIVAPKGENKVRFEVIEATKEKELRFDPAAGSKGGNANCPFCGTVADSQYVQLEGTAERVGFQPIALACRLPGKKGTTFLNSHDLPSEILSLNEEIQDRITMLIERSGLSLPMENISSVRPSPNARGLSAPTRHGLSKFSDLFHPRQILSLLAQCESVRSAFTAMRNEGLSEEYSKAVTTYLGILVDRMADRGSSMCRWDPGYTKTQSTFGRPALPFVWDFSETNPFGDASGDMRQAIDWIVSVIVELTRIYTPAVVERGSALRLPHAESSFHAIITDPPYYDNIPYGDLSDFFYVWLKRAIGNLYPEHFSSDLTPKKSEATALASRFGGDMRAASSSYEEMMLAAFQEARRVLKPGGLLAVVYAHKTTLGWSTLVDALRRAGFTVTEAWPLDTEFGGRLVSQDSAALASSIFLIARKREGFLTGSYEENVRPDLEKIVRERVDSLWKMGITGADLVIAAVGAGLRAFTRFSRVEYSNGEEVPAERFLAEVEGVVLETLLGKIFGVTGSSVAAVDGASRFYVLWRYTFKAAEMDAGEAIVFTYGQNVELDGQNGLSSGSRALVEKKKGKYRLRDFTERGDDDKMGAFKDDGKTAPLIDTLHRILWLLENQPRNLNQFLDEARPNRESLRLIAQALAGTALAGKIDGESEHTHTVSTTPAEQAALKKLVANWRSLIEERLSDIDLKTGQYRTRDLREES
ncbi:MAG: adenine-specific DNA methylase [Deltaproteobacteria bacterium HGW-Deltaproteobacteria-15]|jgi:putative DNA methylase|nr:MAG: adenine-specific DNA methylase [Deltaproteobacteria bacterium HGW-Deltaproteobacteria-15]